MPKTQVQIEVDEADLASWRADACLSGIPLSEWVRRRVSAVSVVPRSKEALDALRKRRDAAAKPVEVPEPSPDAFADPENDAVLAEEDEIPEEAEVSDEAPAVHAVVAAKPKRTYRISNIAGQTFGLLTVVEMTGRRDSSGNRLWRCRCSCEGEKEVATSNLKGGFVKSCGCQKRGRKKEC
jgi:hypothetical protein